MHMHKIPLTELNEIEDAMTAFLDSLLADALSAEQIDHDLQRIGVHIERFAKARKLEANGAGGE